MKLQIPNFKLQGNSKAQDSRRTEDVRRSVFGTWYLNLPWRLEFGIWNFRACGFTLVELLVAISLVAVLVAVGVPATQRVVHKGRATHCLSNLRNLGAALQLYLNDHNNVMPTLVTARESKDSEEEAIDNTLDEYLGDRKAFCCSADAKRLCETTGTSYLWNHLLNGQDTSSMNFFGFIKDGKRIPVMSDKEGWHKYRDVQVNILYADGHVDKDLKFVTGDEK